MYIPHNLLFSRSSKGNVLEEHIRKLNITIAQTSSVNSELCFIVYALN